MGAYVGGKKILDMSRATIRGNVDFNGGNLTDVGTLQGTTIIAGAKSVVGYQNYVEADPATLVVSKDVERKFWKDDFSVDSSDNYLAGEPIVDTVARTLARNKSLSHDSFVVDNGGSVIEYTVGAFTTDSYYNYQGLVFYDDDGVTYAGAILFSFCAAASSQRGMFVLSRDQPLSTYSSSFTYRSGTLNYANNQSETTVRITIKPGQVTAYGSTWNDTQNPSYSGAVADQFLGKRFVFQSFRQFQSDATGYDVYPTLNNYISIAPSISYADDFATDTTERYQPVLGTVAYDNVNKRMNVTTATGANGKASGRLKSYKFCEGSQIYDVTLPTGADGDFICMVTHATNGAMDNGIGVGLQSDGAGNWYLATLSGTTVTVGADSGLGDTDVARIEIEKDITGAYWYYIYNAAGAKPATATGKLSTALSEGYTGWFANGAGATTQTYAIENISIRAESIVGRMNVEATEPFWFRDDFGEDSTGRYDTSLNYDGENNECYVWGRSGIYITDHPTFIGETIVTIQTRNTGVTTDCHPCVVFGEPKKIYAVDTADNFIIGNPTLCVRFTTNSVQVIQNGVLVPGATSTAIKYQSGETQTFVVTYNGSNQITVSDGTNSITFTDAAFAVRPAFSAFIGTYSSSGSNGYENRFKLIEISGTRVYSVYNKPIHRGAMAETVMLDGIETVATTIAYDFNWDCIGEFSGVSSSSVDVVNGRLTLADTDYIYPTGHSAGLGYYQYRIMRSAASGSIELYVAGNVISITNAGAVSFNGGAAESYTIAVTAATLVAFDVGATSIAVYADGVLKGTKTGLTITSSNPKMKRTTADFYVSQMIVVALSPDAIDGFAPSLAGVGGGARFDAVEYIQLTLVNAAKYGKYLLSACCKTTDSDAVAAELYFKNSTDDTDITSDASDTETIALADTNYADFTKDLVLNYDDIDDTVDLRVRRTTATTHNQPPVYVRHLALTPRVEVG